MALTGDTFEHSSPSAKKWHQHDDNRRLTKSVNVVYEVVVALVPLEVLDGCPDEVGTLDDAELELLLLPTRAATSIPIAASAAPTFSSVWRASDESDASKYGRC